MSEALSNPDVIEHRTKTLKVLEKDIGKDNLPAAGRLYNDLIHRYMIGPMLLGTDPKRAAKALLVQLASTCCECIERGLVKLAFETEQQVVVFVDADGNKIETEAKHEASPATT